MAMFRAYFDASGKHDTGVVVVAGYVATAKKWAEYQKKWKAVLSKHNVPYFHMSEFAHSVEAFKHGWRDNETRRREFLGDLITVLYETVEYGVACGVKYEDFATVNREYELKEFFGNAYVLAGWDCIIRLHNYLGPKYPKATTANLTYTFESGDDGAGHLVRLAERARLSIPAFYPSTNTADGRIGVVQLQCADFAAYESFRLSQKFSGQSLPFEEARFTAQLLSSIPGYWGIYTPATLTRTIRENGEVEKRNEAKA